jgi:ketosteroid isomerase-like protein
MERADVARWLADYVEAWRSYDRDRILALFADAAHYRYHPHDEPIIGSQAIADSWFDDPDEPGSYDAAYEPVAIDGEVAVATGSSTYTNPDGSVRAIYDNCYVMRFDDGGRCAEFVEWFVKRPEGTDA